MIFCILREGLFFIAATINNRSFADDSRIDVLSCWGSMTQVPRQRVVSGDIALELSTYIREVSHYPEKASTSATSLLVVSADYHFQN